jgi:hypothetical protein
LLFLGLTWWFGGLAAFVLQNLPSPGLAFWVLSSSCAYFFYALAGLFHFRSLRLVVFLPLFISIPAAFLPFIHQIRLEWPVISRMLSYNYMGGLGALAWSIAGLTLWTALGRAWRGLISRRLHAFFLGLVSVELILVLTSSVRAWALDYGALPSLLSVLAALPALGYIFILSCKMKSQVIFISYRRIVFVLVPGLFFAALSLWFVLSLGSLGRDAPGGYYLPLLNPVELTQLACWAVFAYWQRRLRKMSPPAPHFSSGRLFWVYGLFAFLWLHGVMFRVLQYFSQAEVPQVVDFVELRFIFACIWMIFGVILWLAAISHASGFSWFMGLGLLLAGSIMLVMLSAQLWGYVVVVPLALTELAFLGLMFWRAPAPFSARGRKLGGR